MVGLLGFVPEDDEEEDDDEEERVELVNTGAAEGSPSAVQLNTVPSSEHEYRADVEMVAADAKATGCGDGDHPTAGTVDLCRGVGCECK